MADLGGRFCNFCKSTIFEDTVFQVPGIKPRCFCDRDWELLGLLNTNKGSDIFFVLQLKMTS